MKQYTITPNKVFMFENGKCLIKDGRKIVAKIYDRPEFHKDTKYATAFSKDYPYNLEIPNIGSIECVSIRECVEYINKYTNITL